MSKEFNPHPHLNGAIETLSNKLHLFFKEAFLPNQEEFHHISTFDDLKKIPHSKNGYIQTFINIRPECPKDNLNILDLACGDTPFFRKLLEQHEYEECQPDKCDKYANVVAKKTKYVAVDFDFPPGFRNSIKPILSKLNKCFEFSTHSLDLTQVSDLERLITIKGDVPFDMIILSNALHELPPEYWPDLLSLIPDLIADDGIFVFLDLTNPMDLKDKTSSINSVLNEKSFWEADAVYCLWSYAQEISKKMGMQVTPSFGNDRTSSYWYMRTKKNKNMPSREERKDAIALYLKDFVIEQLKYWKENSKKERDLLINEFRENNIETEDLILSAIRYLCLCASDTRMRECLVPLGLEEIITKKIEYDAK